MESISPNDVSLSTPVIEVIIPRSNPYSVKRREISPSLFLLFQANDSPPSSVPVETKHSSPTSIPSFFPPNTSSPSPSFLPAERKSISVNSIPKFFPPNTSPPISLHVERNHSSSSIPSLFPPNTSLPISVSSQTKHFSLSIPSLFPPNTSLPCSVSSQTNHFSLSIPSLFPPNTSLPSSVSSQTKHFSLSIPSFFPPNQSQSNSVSSEVAVLHGFADSRPSLVFPPNIRNIIIHNYSSIYERTHHHDRSQSPNENRWRSINLDVIDDDDDDDERVFPPEVKAEFEQLAGERWTYAIFWEAERSGDFSPVRGFYNVDDHKFKDKAITFFQLRDSCTETVAFVSFLDLVFRTGNPIWLFGVDCLASSLYFQVHQGYQYGLQTMFWIGVDQGVMEFGSTELID
uniref:Uncharacterized protein n=1 Tax=Quercus lobata TaxID=97700 RepID=A0A7N2MWM3_QUELO